MQHIVASNLLAVPTFSILYIYIMNVCTRTVQVLANQYATLILSPSAIAAVTVARLSIIKFVSIRNSFCDFSC